ncbi:MAG: ParB/RepB/Spo0J family partition protein [Bacilli bacterium]|nr:ParB/RepB/Spo0J family partition protein [Bacilli bacterium]
MNSREKEIIEVALDDIIPNRFQPRLSFDEQGLNELAESIRQHGIIQPLVLRKIGDKYEIIAGERRYKASYIAGLSTVPAVIIDLNDNESAEVAIVENIQRRDLSPIEEAKSYKKLLDRGYLTQDQLAGRMGKTQATISNKLRLLNLDEEVQEALLNNKISERHARSLLRIDDKDLQRKVLNEIIEKRLNVRDTEDLITNKLNNKEDEFIQISNLTNKQKEENPFVFPSLKPNTDELSENDIKLKDLDSILNSTININNVTNLDEQLIEDEEIEVINDYQDSIIPSTSSKKNIDLVIEKINNLITEIKMVGFDVKLDKYDFDSLYQFVIKVEK